MSAIKESPQNRLCDAAVAELVALIAGVADGDHAAFRMLYDRTHRKLFGIALVLLKNRAAAEDALQEAYIRIWTRAGSFDPALGMPLPWLARIVRNISLDRVRQRTVWVEDLSDHHAAPAEDMFCVFAVGELNKCLESLDPIHRTAWRMIHFDGLSREEVASRLKVPLGTVKSWVFRSSIRIRAAVER